MKIIPTRPRLKIARTPQEAQYWSLHTHSRYSNNDAIPEVKEIVETAHRYNQRAIGLSDHGNMAGSVELYQAARKYDMKPFPGSELYFVPDLAQYKKDYANKTKKAQRYHLGVYAYTSRGYENLVGLSTLSHQNFFHKPTLDFNLLAGLAENNLTEGLAISSGCFFGYAVQQLIAHGPEATKRYLATLVRWFPKVYVEIQNHHIDHDEDGWSDSVVADAMVRIADEMGLPVVMTQDSHYCEPEDKAIHEALKRLVAFGPDVDDAVFPGDGFHMVDDQWMREHHPVHFDRAAEGLKDLYEAHTLSIPVLDSYSYSVPQVVPDPASVMEKRCLEELEKRDLMKPRYLKKLDEEFEVINAADMAGYMVLVAMVTDYMTENGIVFQTRGSAAGSLVCWLMGISNVDPLKWDLRFERFLSKDRTKPPDIDLDIAHDRRQELIDWLDTKFVAHQIGSWALYSIDGDDEEGKGSLRVKYFSAAKKKGIELETWADVPEKDKAELIAMADRGMYSGMGTNAAGVVLTSTKEEFNRLVPLAYMPRAGESSGFITQYNKDDVETLGLVKLDVLGSKTLTVLRRTMDNLGLKVSNLEEIEFNDRPTYNLLKSGMTEGVFQMEGGATKWGCKDLKPSHIKDVIAAMALFRPAAMNTGGTRSYIDRKHARENVPQRHALISTVTQPTYGVLLYQEQVIDMLRGMGMGADDLTKFLKAVKASNKNIGSAGEVIKGYQEWIDQRCDELEMSADDKQYLDEAIAGFAEYGFNRAHATVYGITAYRCAYLAVHHPVEFHAALLAVAAGSKKELNYLKVTRKRGVRIMQPHVNISGDTYTVDTRRGAIRKGLLSIAGIGEVSAKVLADLAPYASLEDLVERTPRKPITGGKDFDGTPDSLIGVLGKLRDAKALDGLKEGKTVEDVRSNGRGKRRKVDAVREEPS